MTPQRKLLTVEARRRFAAVVAQPEAALDVAHAALLIAAEEQPGLDVEAYRARLLALGIEARARVAARPDAPLTAFNHFLFVEQGFAGNQEYYNDPRNSLLSQVLERRTGIPLTLSIVYMNVGRRAGLEVEGVGLPGHFIVRVGVPGDSLGGVTRTALVDPYHGTLLDEEDCQQRIDAAYGGQVPLADEHLRAFTAREILVRLLRNLKGNYAQLKRYRRALAVVERILLLDPAAIEERRDRAQLLAHLGRYAEAVRDAQAYLLVAPDAPDATRVREQLKQLQAQQAALN